jgi:hypothetical protein
LYVKAFCDANNDGIKTSDEDYFTALAASGMQSIVMVRVVFPKVVLEPITRYPYEGDRMNCRLHNRSGMVKNAIEYFSATVTPGSIPRSKIEWSIVSGGTFASFATSSPTGPYVQLKAKSEGSVKLQVKVAGLCPDPAASISVSIYSAYTKPKIKGASGFVGGFFIARIAGPC